MSYDELVIEYDEESRWITFRRMQEPASGSGHAALPLRKGFALDDVIGALRATAWIIDREGTVWLERSVPCSTLAEIVAEMLYYFEAPNVPSQRLLRIQSHIDAALEGLNTAGELGLWEYAWLDVIVHTDVADAALSAEDVWTGKMLTLDLEKSRDRWLEAMRLRQTEAARPSEAAMAVSRRSRRRPSDRQQEAG